MNKFAVGINIGATLASGFVSAVNTGEAKINKLTSSVASLSAQKIAVAEVQKYRTELRAVETRAGRAKVVTRALRKELTASPERYKTVAVSASKLGVNLGNLTAEERRLDTALKKTNRTLTARKKLQTNKARRSELQGNFMGAMGSAAIVAAPIAAAVQFESSMADVKKVVNFESPEAFKAMEQDVLSLSTTLPVAASGLTKIIAAAGQSGVAKSRKELLGFTTDAAKMGVAFDISAASAGQMMANWRSGMKLNQAQAVGLADAVNHLSNNMNAEAGALGEVLQRQGAVAMSAGLSQTQAAGLGAALLSSGAGPEIAATAMKNLTGALVKGKAATSTQQKAFEALGFDAVNMAERMQTDAVGGIKAVFSALNEAPKAEQNALVTQLFGEESKGAIMPLLSNMDNLHKAFNLTADTTAYAGSMQAEFSARSATTGNNLTLLRNRVTRLAVSSGSILLPALNSVLAPIGGVLDIGVQLVTTFPTVSTVVVGAAVAFALILPTMLAVRYGVTAVSDVVEYSKTVWGGFNKVIGWSRKQLIAHSVVSKATSVATRIMAASQWALNIAMNANPIGLLIAGGVALVGVGYLVYKHWDKVKTLLATALKWSPVGFLVKGFTAAKNFLSTIDWSASGASILKTLASGILSVASAPVKAVKNVLSNVRKYLPFADAKPDPSSTLTASGAAIPSTMAKGVSKDTSLAGAMGKSLPTAPAIGGRGGGGIHIDFKPTIQINGGGNVKDQVNEALQVGEQRLRKMLENILHNDRRISYA